VRKTRTLREFPPAREQRRWTIPAELITLQLGPRVKREDGKIGRQVDD
jgi:hypothetical protein